MTIEEFDNQFDVLYNNITSNQAPGLNTYEKSVFLTKAQNEIVKNYFTANSKGNNIGQGFDDSAKRQADFSGLMKTSTCNIDAEATGSNDRIDPRSLVLTYPPDVFIVINETMTSRNTITSEITSILQIIPLRYDEYTRLMSKPFKRPLKNQAWRLLTKGEIYSNTPTKYIELILPAGWRNSGNAIYNVRYIRRPKPIIVGDLDGLTIDGYEYSASPSSSSTPPQTDGECELDPILHEDILQRAVELAKVAWTATGNDNAQMVLQAGQRSE
jgi:hypothetical protein